MVESSFNAVSAGFSLISIFAMWAAWWYIDNRPPTFLNILCISAVGGIAGSGWSRIINGLWPDKFSLSLDWFSQIFSYFCAALITGMVIYALLIAIGAVRRS